MQNILKVFSSKDGYKKADEFYLGNKSIWTFGKKVDKNIPDVLLFSSFPELQGKLVCEDGFWFYLNYDHSTEVYHNRKRITSGLGGRIKPVCMEHGDELKFVCGDGEIRCVFTKEL